MSLRIYIKKQEYFNEETNTFDSLEKDYSLLLEHSLLSVSKWEAKWHKPYLTDKDKTEAEIKDYIRCMTINQDVPDIVYDLIPNSEIAKIVNYINDPSTATTIKEQPQKQSIRRETLTNELIYYYMFKLNIPKECEKWHINKLITLLRVFSVKEEEASPNKKMSRSELIARNKALNAKNRARFNSKG